MTNINISIKKEAHEFLKSLKSDNKSFSDVIIEFKHKKGNKENIMRFFGVLKDSGVDWKEKEKRMKDFRKEFDERINRTMKRMGEL